MRTTDLRFDWLTDLPGWESAADGGERLELEQTELVRRSGGREHDWAFAFLSWASARLIRTGEWHAVERIETRDGVQRVRIERHPAPCASGGPDCPAPP
ncbi:hypothetical protein [Luteimonas terrae]|uniref:Uncharacterized protein n=1 Tax=Luteimonas terrae TaxID=1530191 RepID=A0A4R5U649_9GAMM|nr:hypothetical protein [Luteimonas terrae]TDK29255.1 hypothetical protein E2F49_15070 [Luteimonas terrae]